MQLHAMTEAANLARERLRDLNEEVSTLQKRVAALEASEASHLLVIARLEGNAKEWVAD
jgi:uncharacterized protein YlxW (UPF0749 family)